MTAFWKVAVTLRNQHRIRLYNARVASPVVPGQATEEAGNRCAQFPPEGHCRSRHRETQVH